MISAERPLYGVLRKKNRFGDLDTRWKPTTAAVVTRLLRDCRGLTPGLTGCLVWSGSVAHTKYKSSPRFYLNGRHVSLRKMMYIWFVGPLANQRGKPDEWVTTCRKHLCINPLHLRLRYDLKQNHPNRYFSTRRKRKRRTTTTKKIRKHKNSRVITSIGLSLSETRENNSLFRTDKEEECSMAGVIMGN